MNDGKELSNKKNGASGGKWYFFAFLLFDSIKVIDSFCLSPSH